MDSIPQPNTQKRVEWKWKWNSLKNKKTKKIWNPQNRIFRPIFKNKKQTPLRAPNLIPPTCIKRKRLLISSSTHIPILTIHTMNQIIQQRNATLALIFGAATATIASLSFLYAFNSLSKYLKGKLPKHQITNPEHQNKPVHRGITCSFCEGAVIGIRYKCSSCVSFDLCEKCEKDFMTHHDPTHLLLKIQIPLPPLSIGNKQLLPKLYPGLNTSFLFLFSLFFIFF